MTQPFSAYRDLGRSKWASVAERRNMCIRGCPRHDGTDCVRSINEANDLLRAGVTVSGLVALAMAAVVGPKGTLIDSALALPTCAVVVVWLSPGFTGHNMQDPLYLVRGDIECHSKANDTGPPQCIPHNNGRVRCAWVSLPLVRHTNPRVVEDPNSKPSIHVEPGLAEEASRV